MHNGVTESWVTACDPLPVLCSRLPLCDEVGDVLMKYLLTLRQNCLKCDNKRMNFVARYAVWYGRMTFPLVLAYFSVALGMTLSIRILCH